MCYEYFADTNPVQPDENRYFTPKIPQGGGGRGMKMKKTKTDSPLPLQSRLNRRPTCMPCHCNEIIASADRQSGASKHQEAYLPCSGATSSGSAASPSLRRQPQNFCPPPRCRARWRKTPPRLRQKARPITPSASPPPPSSFRPAASSAPPAT